MGTEITRDLSNVAVDTFNWCIGATNLNAINDIRRDKYYFNENDPTALTKVKQVGVELIHMGLKYSTWVTLLDKGFYSLTEKSLGLAQLLPIPVHVTIPGSLGTVKDIGQTALGLVALTYIAKTSAKNLYEAKKNFSNVIQNGLEDHVNPISDLVEGIGNIAPIFPVIHLMRTQGPVNGAIIAAPLIFASTHYESANTNYAKFAKLGIVVWTASQTPILSDIAGYGLKAVAWAVNLLGKGLGG